MKISCIIVCYNPDLVNLAEICKASVSAGANVILIDNTESSYMKDFLVPFDFDLIALNENVGIAKAQNIGINKALENGADAIVFFDQDSEIEDGFIEQLTAPLKHNEPMVVSPVFYAKEGFRYPSYKMRSNGLLYAIEESDEIHDVDMIISSGSAATKPVFEIAGLMNEDYFIDFVDNEWCLRCRAKNIPIKVVPSATMIHTIGEKSVDFGFMRVFIHSPIRSYYKVRNSFLFFKNKNVPFLMGLKEIVSALLHNFMAIFIADKKSTYIKNYFRGIYDGILGRKGKKK